MGFGEILDRIFSLYRQHFLLFLGMITLYFCGSLVVYLLNRFLPDFPLKYIVECLVSMPFDFLSMGGIIIVTATIYSGGHITIRDALKQTKHRLWYMLACYLSWSLAYMLPRVGIALLIIPMIDIEWTSSTTAWLSILYVFRNLISLPFSLYVPIDWSHIILSFSPSVIGFVMMPGGLWIRLILSVFALSLAYFAVRWLFATTLILLERPLLRRAFARSSELTRGRWWRVLGILISFSVLSFVLQRIGYTSVGFILTLTKLAGTASPIDILQLVITRTSIDADPLFYTIMSWTWRVLGTLIFPIPIIGITLLYFDLQIRKEGTGIGTVVDNTIP